MRVLTLCRRVQRVRRVGTFQCDHRERERSSSLRASKSNEPSTPKSMTMPVAGKGPYEIHNFDRYHRVSGIRRAGGPDFAGRARSTGTPQEADSLLGE